MSLFLDRPNILLVDDLPGNILVLAGLLDTHYEISVATSGQEALEIASLGGIDLILLDILMPGISGYEVCRILKEREETKEIPVIFVTSKNDPWDETKGLGLGAVDFLTKPVRAQIVQARVKTHLDLKKKSDSLKKLAHELEQRVEQRTQELQTTVNLLSKEVDERIRAEQALTSNQAKLQAIVDTAVDGIITINEQGVIEFVNVAGEKMFGYDAGELVGQNLTLLMTSPDRERHDNYLQHYRINGKSPQSIVGSSREIIGLRKDGTLFSIELGVAEVKLEKGSLFTGMLRDITERKVAEETAIRNARLASLGTLAAGVAHEINNPNNAIGFSAATLTRLWQGFSPHLRAYQKENSSVEICGLGLDEALETTAELVGEVGENSRRISAIVANLKHMTRGDVGNLDRVVDIDESLRSAVALLKNVIQKQTDHFSLNQSGNLRPIKGNFQQLEQVFINLIQNALQSLPSRDKGVSITTKMSQQDNRPMVEVWVQDQGSGISGDRMDLITKPFYTTKEEQGGTGLGLSISKTILDNHNGSLTFQSTPNQGTTALVRLPAMRQVSS